MRVNRRSLMGGMAASSLALAFSGRTLAAPRLTLRADDGLLLPSTNAWLEIDRQAFIHNIRTLRAFLAPSVKICAVLKADANGHGISLLVPAVIAENVPAIGITSNDEARIARKMGYRGRIIRLRIGTIDEVEDGLGLSIEESVGNLDHARKIGALALRHKRTIAVHFVLNSTSMSRNDLDLGTARGRQDALDIVAVKGIKIVALMTHFPVEDVDDCARGLARFKTESQWVIDNGRLDRQALILHAAASFATLSLVDSHFDMVRVGGVLYGDPPAGHPEYHRVMAFKSTVAVVNAYPMGNSVSYDRTATLSRDSLLANIPFGYAEGYSRLYSNKADMLIRGQRARVTGRVTMNTIMVDVTDIPGVTAGDEVVVFGNQAGAEITQSELEQISQSPLFAQYTVWGSCMPKVLKKA